MTVFWIGAFALTIIAIILIFWPWLFKSHRDNQDRERLNVMLAKERVKELQRDLEENILTEEQRQQAESELKLALLGEIEASREHERIDSQAVRTSPVLVVLSILCVVVAAASYWQSNEINSLNDWQRAKERLPELGERVVVKADSTLNQQDMQDFVLGLRTRLAEKPDDAVGWLLLGRIFSSSRNIELATEAFEKSLVLEPERVGTLISYSQALLMLKEEGSLNRAKQMLLKAVSLAPSETDALGLLAITASQMGDRELATTSWRKLSAVLPADDPLQTTIQNRISELEKEPTQLMVNINIADELRSKLPEQAFLFVFARAADAEMKMPAAVVKQPLTDFPLSVTLSDTNAMVEALNLSSLDNAQVIVRVSKDDKVMAENGDLQGEMLIPISKSQMNDVSITIDKELP